MLVDWDRFALWSSRPPAYLTSSPPLPFLFRGGGFLSLLLLLISISRPGECVNPATKYIVASNFGEQTTDYGSEPSEHVYNKYFTSVRTP